MPRGVRGLIHSPLTAEHFPCHMVFNLILRSGASSNEAFEETAIAPSLA